MQVCAACAWRVSPIKLSLVIGTGIFVRAAQIGDCRADNVDGGGGPGERQLDFGLLLLLLLK